MVSLIRKATKENKMDEARKQEEYQEKLFTRADEILDAELAKGKPFTEGLCNWATHQAQQEIGEG